MLINIMTGNKGLVEAQGYIRQNNKIVRRAWFLTIKTALKAEHDWMVYLSSALELEVD